MLSLPASALATNFNVNLTETNTTSDAVTALKNCKPVSLVETNVGSDSASSVKPCKPVSIIDTYPTNDVVSVSRSMHANMSDTNHPFISDQVTSGRALNANIAENLSPQFIQAVTTSAAGNSATVTMPPFALASPGNLIFCHLHLNSGTPLSSVVDSMGNTFTVLSGGASGEPAVFAQAKSFGGDTVTFTFSSIPGNTLDGACALYSGLPSPLAVDQTLFTNQGSANWSTGNVAPTSDREWVLAYGWSSGGGGLAQPGAGFTMRYAGAEFFEDLFQASNAPVAGTVNWSASVAGHFSVTTFATVPRDSLSGIRNVFGPLPENLNTVDNCAAAKNGPVCHPVGIIETYPATDFVSGARHAVNVAPTESVGPAASSIALQRGPVGLVAENHTTADAVAATAGHFAAMTESNTTTSAVATGGLQRSVNVTEVISESDSVGRAPNHFANFVESLSVNDTLLVTKCGTEQEFFTTTDVLAVVRSAIAQMAETNSAVDSIRAAANKQIVETNTTSDSLNAQKPGSFSVNISNQSTTSDSVSAVHAAAATMTDTLIAATSAISAKHAAVANVQESQATIDVLVKNGGLHASMTDFFSASDQLAAVGPGVRSVTIAETLSASSSVTAVAQHFASMSENSATSDSAARNKGPFIVLVENLSAADQLAASHTAHPIASMVEALSTGDTVSITAPHVVSFTETSFTSDSAAAGRLALRRRFVLVDSP